MSNIGLMLSELDGTPGALLRNNGKLRTDFRSFVGAKNFMHALKKVDAATGPRDKRGWEVWRKSGEKPRDIPAHPERVYRNSGWVNLANFLGYESQHVTAISARMLPFMEARPVVRKLKLKSQKEWWAWSKSGKRPSNIPSDPSRKYRDAGWMSWPDWLGNGKQYDMLSFVPARAIVRKLKMETYTDWKEWSKSGQRPSNIPAYPQQKYRDAGWISIQDWLGSSIETVHESKMAELNENKWTCTYKKKSRKFKCTSPDGEVFSSLKRAYEHYMKKSK
jgi:hypothetical protein